MKQWMKLGLGVSLGLGVMAGGFVSADDAFAQGRGKKADRLTATAPVEPPLVKNPEGIEIKPTGLRWGMTSAQLVEFYSGEIDRAYKPQYDKAQPGPATDRLDAAVASAKDAFRRSKIEFGELPTGIDSTALRSEYTYKNGESMMQMSRSAGKRYFFFFNDKLWKIYDELPLGEGKPMGSTFEEAAQVLATRYGVAGRETEIDYVAGRNFTELDWQDARTRVRLLDRSGLRMVGMVYEERATLNNLAALRVNKPADLSTVDPSVEALMRPPPPPPDEKKKDPKKK